MLMTDHSATQMERAACIIVYVDMAGASSIDTQPPAIAWQGLAKQ